MILPPRKAAVLGSPISHSLSPAIFAFICAREKTNLVYTTKETTPDSLSSVLETIRQQEEWIGVNVTLPLKEIVWQDLDALSPEAQALGAVNVVYAKDKKLTGYNTDVIGIKNTLIANHCQIKGKHCLMWGAGGSAKAVAYVLGAEGAATVSIYNPRSDRGASLAQNFQKLFPNTEYKVISSLERLEQVKISLTVNTTPVGMKKSTPDSNDDLDLFKPMDRMQFTSDALAFDLIYIPEATPFLARARARRLKTASGLGMLIDQAIATYELWVKPIENKATLHAALTDHLRGILKLREDPAPVFLTGFMGVGKTAIGLELARVTHREFLDTDQLIEKQEMQSVQKIFEAKGEPEFRKLEHAALAKASQTKNAVVSLGGGAIMREDNFQLTEDSGTLIYLYADEQTLFERLSLQGTQRPLLANLDEAQKRDKIHALLSVRESTYRRAKITIDTSGKQPREIAQTILSRIGALHG